MYSVSIEQRFGIAVLRNRKFCKRCTTSNARPNSTEHQPLMIGSDIWLLARAPSYGLKSDSDDR
jgi:hypothetical protein